MSLVATRLAKMRDAPSIAALHADSWRRNYRGCYRDDYLDGDVDSERLQVWTERLGAAEGNTRTLVAELEAS